MLFHAKGPTDFIKLTIVNGNQLQFQYQAGGGPISVIAEVSYKLSDDQWHASQCCGAVVCQFSKNLCYSFSRTESKRGDGSGGRVAKSSSPRASRTGPSYSFNFRLGYWRFNRLQVICMHVPVFAEKSAANNVCRWLKTREKLRNSYKSWYFSTVVLPINTRVLIIGP